MWPTLRWRRSPRRFGLLLRLTNGATRSCQRSPTSNSPSTTRLLVDARVRQHAIERRAGRLGRRGHQVGERPPDNSADHGLPTVMRTMIYSGPETAFPLAVMDGTELTRQRTGAAAAVAPDYLAVEDATSLGIVGAGVQSYTQLEAIAEVRPIEEAVVIDVDEEASEAFGDRFDVRGSSSTEAGSCDVLSRSPRRRSDRRPRGGRRVHSRNAMRADAAGKQVLDPRILSGAKLIIDDYERSPIPARSLSTGARGRSTMPTSTGRSVRSSLTRSRAGRPTTGSRCSTRPGWRSRI